MAAGKRSHPDWILFDDFTGPSSPPTHPGLGTTSSRAGRPGGPRRAGVRSRGYPAESIRLVVAPDDARDAPQATFCFRADDDMDFNPSAAARSSSERPPHIP